MALTITQKAGIYAPKALHLQKLSFRYQAGGPDLLHCPDFSVEAGSRVFIQGPSGAGKSTLLSLIAGVLNPSEGSIKILGKDLQKLSPAARDQFRAEHMGFIFQLFNLIPYLSVLDNVLLGLRFAKQRAARVRDPRQEAMRLLSALGLSSDTSFLQRQASELSVGQQQRVACARALLGRPELLIADEPTSALDDEAKARFLELLFTETASYGATLLYVSHDSSMRSHFATQVPMSTFKVGL